MEVDVRYFQFRHPFTCMVAGPTSSGKTVLVKNILRNSKILVDGVTNPKITWAYGQWQKGYAEEEGFLINYIDGLPTEEDIIESKTDILVIDDLMTELGGDKKLANLFTKGSHHLSLSIIFIVQNIFHQAKCMRNVSLNCHYFLLLKNPRDRSQIYSLARQLYPTNSRYFIEAYEDATKEPFSYLKIDLTPNTPDKYRLQARIIPLDKGYMPIVYFPKNV